jgi:pyrroloquinoline-quinone synthase
LLNASPDVRYQIESCRHLHPRPGTPRSTPIAGVVLTNADLDHCLGLFSLREAQPLLIYATSAVKAALVEHNVICRTLERFPEQVRWVELEPRRRIPLLTPDGGDVGLSVEAVCVPGKVPQYLEGLVAPAPEHNVALLIREQRSDRSLVYMPGVAGDTPEVRRLLVRRPGGLRRHILVGGRALDAHPERPVGARNGSLAARRRKRQSGSDPRQLPRPLRAHAPEQHQSSSARGLRSAQGALEGGDRGRARRHGTARMSGEGTALDRADFEVWLRRESSARYHDKHPFHVAMHEGRLGRREIAVWIVNRYYYQTRIPIKDALILAKSEDSAFRREWLRRLRDQDGEHAGAGGLELWLRLGEAAGIAREELITHAHVLPDVRRACDAYVELVQGASLVEAVAASLTETLAPDLMRRRIAAWQTHYPWLGADGIAYFQTRVSNAERDGCEALAFVLSNARSYEQQAACLRALVKKTEILWQLLDAVQAACERPRLARRARLVWDPENRKTLLLYPENGLSLNRTAAEIVELCTGELDVSEIVSVLSSRHEVERSRVEPGVWRMLEALRSRALLEARPT